MSKKYQIYTSLLGQQSGLNPIESVTVDAAIDNNLGVQIIEGALVFTLDSNNSLVYAKDFWVKLESSDLTLNG